MSSNYLTLSRQALYDLVWSKPMTQVAGGFGISDVALAKRCAAIDVPVPRRGYWARLAAGQTPRRTPLPRFRRSDQVPVEPVARILQRAARQVTPKPEQPPLPPPPTINALDDFLPAVKRAARHYRHADRASLNFECGTRRGAFPRLDVAAGTLDRALRFVDRLLRAANDRGWTLVAPEPPKQPEPDRYRRSATDAPSPPGPPQYGLLQIGAERIEFRIEERTETRDLPPTEQDLARKRRDPSYHKIPKTETRALGLLRLVRPSPGYFLHMPQRSWSERGEGPIEEKLASILEDFGHVAELKKSEREENEREARARAEANRLSQELESRREANAALMAELERQAGAWYHAHRLRAYVRAVRRVLADRSFSVDLNGAPVDFLDWAETYVDEIDPLMPVPHHPDRAREHSYYCRADEGTVRTALSRWLNLDGKLPQKLAVQASSHDDWEGLDDD